MIECATHHAAIAGCRIIVLLVLWTSAVACDSRLPVGVDTNGIGTDGAAFWDGGLRDKYSADGSGVVPGTWVMVRAGTFIMGSPTSEPCRVANETAHHVTLTHPFEIQTTEVTQGQFQQVMGYNPASFSTCGASCPVETVSWYEAVAYANALSRLRGLTPCYACKGSGKSITCTGAAAYLGAHIYECPGYRLPTEAEWEYAYRAGTTTPYHNGPNDPKACDGTCQTDARLDQIAWYCKNAGSKTHPVARKKPNAWGIFDMAGSLWEWCNDLWNAVGPGPAPVTNPWGGSFNGPGAMRLNRGGSWDFVSFGHRAAYRNWYYPTSRNDRYGFRCVRTR